MRYQFVFVVGVVVTLVWQLPTSSQNSVAAKQNYPVLPQASMVIPKRVYAQQLRFAPNSAYKKETIRGFSVWINRQVLEHKPEAKEMLKELDWQLLQINRIVPPKPLSALQKVRIWVEWDKQYGAAQFHPSAQWLRQNGYNPDKAGAVEVSNTRNFVNWSRSDQPWMILHELTHAYHFLTLGNSYPIIEAAYQQAVDSRLYQSVDYIKGGKQKAYALTNAKEYFAELSEAYFGKNDFYPFTYTQLQKYDPVGYQMMEKTWGKLIKSKTQDVR